MCALLLDLKISLMPKPWSISIRKRYFLFRVEMMVIRFSSMKLAGEDRSGFGSGSAIVPAVQKIVGIKSLVLQSVGDEDER